MNGRLRRLVPALIVLAFAALLGTSVARLPAYGQSRGTYEQRRNVNAVGTRHVTNLDAFVNFDLRGFDTLGEEFIFFVSVAGFALLLRERRGSLVDRPKPAADGRRPNFHVPEVRVAARAYVAVTFVYGAYMVVHGQLTPGGGFQGGVVLATGALAVFLGSGFAAYERVFPKEVSEIVETTGAAGYVLIGVSGVIGGGVFLANIMPLGVTGALLSGGTILALNDVVALAVAAGFVVLFSEFLKETRQPESENGG